MITLEQFGGIADGKTPNDVAMRKAIEAAISVTYPNYKQRAIRLAAGKYRFNEPIEWLPRKSYNPSLQLIGEGGVYGHPAYASTVLEFKHEDDRPCVRITGNAAHLEGFLVSGLSQSVAIELGNDAWEGRVDEERYTGDQTCNRSLLRNVGTWGCDVGVSIRSWGTTTLDRVCPSWSKKQGIRLAGNAINLRDCYVSTTVSGAIGVYVEFGSVISIAGGAIEGNIWTDSQGQRRTTAAGGILIKQGDGIHINSVYMEGMPYAVRAENVNGLVVSGFRAGSVRPENYELIANTDDPTRGYLVELKNSKNTSIVGNSLLWGKEVLNI